MVKQDFYYFFPAPVKRSLLSNQNKTLPEEPETLFLMIKLLKNNCWNYCYCYKHVRDIYTGDVQFDIDPEVK